MTELARHHDLTAVMLVDNHFDIDECRLAMQTYCHDVALVPNPYGRDGQNFKTNLGNHFACCVEGVAIAVLMTSLLLAVPSIAYAGRPIGIGVSLLRPAVSPQFIGAVSAAAAGCKPRFSPIIPAFVRIFLSAPSVAAFTLPSL
jgi:hypothetical protein